MAEKVECDKCAKQWTPIQTRDDTERASLSLIVPLSKGVRTISGWEDRPGIDEHFDLCQSCARMVYEFIVNHGGKDG